jgi:hypothetical protein
LLDSEDELDEPAAKKRWVEVPERSEYDDKRHSPEHAAWKDAMSHRFANYAKEIGGPIVYFDGNALRTTDILLGHGIAPDLLYVANPDKDICNALQAKGVHTFCGIFEDSNFEVDFASAYLDTTYADSDKIKACIDKVAGECQLIGFTMLPRDAQGRSMDHRANLLIEYLGHRNYRVPNDVTNYYSDHAGVWTRFYPLTRD